MNLQRIRRYRSWTEIGERLGRYYGEILREIAVIGERCAANPIAKSIAVERGSGEEEFRCVEECRVLP
ncbi:hypothetical protein F2Q69_00034769 [Brassica cretica]|uniref:Uncharacterized protein n=1 Tax=Brassica cretica TaxID=69181 RepID=A0A8S9SAS1_BRACR|nr:hypothetical protein F2Q69_00034769 [Brassica cretica]